MKKYLFITVVCGLLFPFIGMAQKQGSLSRFIVGTEPLNFAIENTKFQNQNNDGGIIPVTNTSSTNSQIVSAHINLFVGYFVTKNICTGLQFGKNAILSPFIRYYPFHKNPDSSKVDFFLQANFTFNASNTNYPYREDTTFDNYNTTSAYSVTTTIFDFGIGAAVAWNFTRHWALEGEIGYVYKNSVTNTGSYTETSGNPNLGAPPQVATVPALKNTDLTNEGALRFMLSYRL